MVIHASKIIMQVDVHNSGGGVTEGQGAPFYIREGVAQLSDGKRSAMKEWHSGHPEKRTMICREGAQCVQRTK